MDNPIASLFSEFQHRFPMFLMIAWIVLLVVLRFAGLIMKAYGEDKW